MNIFITKKQHTPNIYQQTYQTYESLRASERDMQGRGMFIYWNHCWIMTCYIIQACIQGHGMCATGKWRRLTTCIITYGLHASVLSYTHGLAISTMVWVHQPREITCFLCSSAKRHWVTTRINNQGMQASVAAYVWWLIDISPSLRSMSRWRWLVDGSISQVLHTSNAACVHKLGDTVMDWKFRSSEVSKRKAQSTKVFTHLT